MLVILLSGLIVGTYQTSIVEHYNLISKYHEKGVRGQGVKIAILDSGIGRNQLEQHELLGLMNIV